MLKYISSMQPTCVSLVEGLLLLMLTTIGGYSDKSGWGGVGKIRFFKGISRKNKEFWGKIPFFCDILPIFGWF